MKNLLENCSAFNEGHRKERKVHLITSLWRRQHSTAQFEGSNEKNVSENNCITRENVCQMEQNTTTIDRVQAREHKHSECW